MHRVDDDGTTDHVEDHTDTSPLRHHRTDLRGLGSVGDLAKRVRRRLNGPTGLAARYVAAGCASAVGLEWLTDPAPTATAIGASVVTGAAASGHARWARRTGRIPRYVADPLARVRRDAARGGGGAFVGVDASAGSGVVHAPAETAVLVLGPPRRGKSSSVIIPSVLTAPGAVVSTSTKPDVLLATAPARSRFGRVWVFDPTGQVRATDLPDGVHRLRWSPLDSAVDWGASRRLAQAVVGASPAAKGTRHESHWTSRAAALLAPMLYAAAGARLEMRDIVTWVLAGDIDLPKLILDKFANDGDPDAALALEVLRGVQQAADQERQSIWSTTADVIDVYTTTAALAAASDSNWQPEQFVDSADTIYIAASAEYQTAVAPLVVALVEAVRNAQYARHRHAALDGGDQGSPVSLVLDEVANVAPIASLPALVSEAGGQGLHVVAAVQDLSQVRGRWGSEVADGFLSLFQHVLVLGGIRDTRTLEAVSTICGEHDIARASSTRTRTRSTWKPWELGSTSVAHGTSIHRQRRMDAGHVYALPDGTGLHLYGSDWRTVRLAPHYAHPRWTSVLAAVPKRIERHDDPATPAGPDVLSVDGRRVDTGAGEIGEPAAPTEVPDELLDPERPASSDRDSGVHPVTRPRRGGRTAGRERQR